MATTPRMAQFNDAGLVENPFGTEGDPNDPLRWYDDAGMYQNLPVGRAAKKEAPAGSGSPGGPVDPMAGLTNNIAQPTTGAVLDPQMSEVEPPKLPDMARAGLLGASAGSTGGAWQVQPIQQMNTGDLGKRIYPPGGTGLTGRRVY